MEASRFNLIPIAAAMALLMASGGANAGVYGYSYDNIFGLTVTNPTGAVAVTSSAYTTNNSARLWPVPPPPLTTSGALNAPQAAAGSVTKAEDNFTQQGPGPQGSALLSYARADTQFVSTQFPPLPANSASTQAVNVAEAHLASPGVAHAEGRNSATVNFTVASPAATLLFRFVADPYMEAFIFSGGPGTAFVIGLETTFRISNDTGTVFDWAPDGFVDQTSILGGTEEGDPASLNISAAVSSTNTVSLLYNPTDCLAPNGTGTGTSCGALFSALTDPLPAGNYTLEFNAAETVDLVKAAEVPEPGTLALLGLGLAGMCYTSRRKAG